MRLVRRFLVLVALMFWQGGFLFYAAVVVPVGQRVLGSHLRQGFITREVTWYLNLSGAAALAVLLWDALASGDRSAWRRRLRSLSWVGMAVAQGGLFWLHDRLDRLLVPQGRIILDPEEFTPGHRLYLWTSTVQWALGLVYAGLALWAWRSEDQQHGAQRAE
jgi:hypothetical protein